jgi:hypothetical protein
VLLVLTTAMFALEPLSKHAEHSEVVAAALVPLLILGIALGIASLRERWEPARPRVAAWTMGVLFVSTCGRFASQPAENEKARAATMSQLQIDSMTIRHKGLRFELPHPGAGFNLDSARQAEADSTTKGRMLAWVFTHETVPHALTVMVVDSVRRGEHGFRSFVSGIRKKAREQATQMTEDTLSWHDEQGEFRTAYAMNDERIRLRCISYQSEPFQIRIVCAMTASLEGDSLAFVREGLRARARSPA